MANDIWFISDTHFFHTNILKFTGKDNQPIRPGFKNTHEMNEYIVERWNREVKPQDKVYHLGDVAIKVSGDIDGPLDRLLKRLNGHKRLILGNHDHIYRQPALTRHFEKIDLWTGGKFKKEGFVASHIPLRDDQMRGAEVNVHGHIHQNKSPTERHVCVCVEQTGYIPIHIDNIPELLKEQHNL